MLKSLFLKFKRLIIYGAVGCVNTLVDFGVFTLCAELGLRPSLSQAAGYATGVVCSFLLNRNITFRDGRGKVWQQALLFVVINLVSLAVTSLLMGWLTDAGLNKYISKVLVTVLSMLINYFGYKRVVFQIKEEKEDKRDE